MRTINPRGVRKIDVQAIRRSRLREFKVTAESRTQFWFNSNRVTKAVPLTLENVARFAHSLLMEGWETGGKDWHQAGLARIDEAIEKGTLHMGKETITIIVETFDIDPDGMQTAWHRVEVPRDRVYFYPDTVRDWIAKNGNIGPVDISRLMSEMEFAENIFPQLDMHGQDYWSREGYANSGSRNA